MAIAFDPKETIERYFTVIKSLNEIDRKEVRGIIQTLLSIPPRSVLHGKQFCRTDGSPIRAIFACGGAAFCFITLATDSSRQSVPRRVRCPRLFSVVAMPRSVVALATQIPNLRQKRPARLGPVPDATGPETTGSRT